MLYLIGLGLCDPSDITVKGLEIVKRASHVYLEAYTSILISSSKKDLEDFYGREIILADREMIEQNADDILKDAGSCDVALLVVGDPLGATTHSDLLIRAADLGLQYQVIHNASIMNAVGCCGLQLYHFGETVSIPYWTDSWRPDSFLTKIESNLQSGLHTLCLLDIKVKEQTIENLMRGKNVYEPPRYMSMSTAALQLLEAIAAREAALPDKTLKCLSAESRCVGLARVGSATQCVAHGTLTSIRQWEFGGPLHSLVVVGNVHPLEERMLQLVSNAKMKE